MVTRIAKIHALVIWALCLAGAAFAKTQPDPCNDTLLQTIPQRSTAALNGSEFAQKIQSVSDHQRETAIEAELLSGNLPGFLRRLIPVNLSNAITICVLPDYLAVGSDAEFLFVPMRLATALAVASRYRFTLPTTRMVDAIYEQAAVHLAPQPLPAGDQMRSTDYYWHHTQMIRQQEATLRVMPGALTSGDKKDLVITNLLWQNLARIAIYGWHRLDHSPIQPLATVHGARYADYSHGVRLVSDVIYVNGEPQSIFTALTEPETARTLSGEGPIQRITQLLTILAVPPPEATPTSGSALQATR